MKAIVATTIMLVLTACQPEQPEKNNSWAQDIAVETRMPGRQAVIDWDEYTGRFEASKTVAVKPRVGGFINKVLFKDGAPVLAGQALYELDQRPFEIALKSAEANLILARKDLDRAKNLRAKNAISQEMLDTKTAEQESKQAAYDRAALSLEFSTVRAPISGLTDRTYVDAGNPISGGDLATTTLTTIVTLDPIFFYFNASERDVLKYLRRNISQANTPDRDTSWPVEVKLQDEAGYMHKGVINFVGNTINQGAGTLEIRAEFANPDQLLQPGFFGRLRIAPTEPYMAMVIPQDVIIAQGQKKFVYIVGDKNTVVPRYIELGNLTADGLQIVKSGLKEEDKIIVSNLQMLRPGAKVKTPSVNPVTGE